MMPTLIHIYQWAVSSIRNERGAAAVEYGIMVALIAAVIVGTVALIGTQLLGAFNIVNANLP